MAPRSPLRKAAAWAVLVLSAWAAVEALCQAALFAVAALRGLPTPVSARFRLEAPVRRQLERMLDGEPLYYALDAELGWTVRPDGRLPLYRANAQGLRADRVYAERPPPGTLRIAAFGDSFVHGSEVANQDAWPARLERLRPDLEVLNFGVGGYGVDQAWLRWRREGQRFEPQLVLIGFMTEDIHRSVNRFRPFLSPQQPEPRAKPRFVLRDAGGLALLPNPLPTLDAYRALVADEAAVLPRVGRGDAFYQALWRPTPLSILPSLRLARFARFALSPARTIVDGRFNPRSEAFEVTARVIEGFHAEVRAAGSLGVVLFLPTREDFERRRDRRGDAWAPLRERLGRDGIESLDVIDCFERPRFLRAVVFMKGGHYGPATNRVVARCLLEAFEARGWLAHAQRDRADVGASGIKR